MRDLHRNILLGATVAAIVVAILWVGAGPKSSVPDSPAGLPSSEEQYDGAPDFSGASGWLNTPNGTAIDLVSLRGQVVLVDFWTYSCINCLHTLPHVTRLYDTYNASGFTVIGVHTPEFGFEKVPANVERAIKAQGIHYPVPQDNDYGIWEGYNNHYWPAHYVIDQYGKLRFQHFGEGGYAEAEEQVRQLLREAGHEDLPTPFETGDGGGGGPQSPELYAAHGRSAVANPEGYSEGQVVEYARPDPAGIAGDRIYLSGSWFDGAEAAVAQSQGSVLVRFTGAGANVVLDAPTGCLPITLDGDRVPAALAGPDVDVAQSCLRVDGADSYDFFAGASGTHTVEIQAVPGLKLFTFDFTGGP